MNTVTKLLFALTLIFSFSACGDDNKSSDSNSLEGTWTVVEFTADAENSTTGNGLSIISTTSVKGSNLNYDLVFDGANWTTEGSYSYDILIETSGQIPISTTESVSNVEGLGTFSTNEDVMTINGSFFTLEYNGQNIVATDGPQMVNYEINNEGQLVFSQNDVTETNTTEINSSSVIITRSVWERK